MHDPAWPDAGGRGSPQPGPQHLPRASPSCERNTNGHLQNMHSALLQISGLEMVTKVKNRDNPGPHRRHLHPAEGTPRCNCMKNKRIAQKKNFISLVQNMWDHSPRATKLAMGIFVSCSSWLGGSTNRTRARVADHGHCELKFK